MSIWMAMLTISCIHFLRGVYALQRVIPVTYSTHAHCEVNACVKPSYLRACALPVSYIELVQLVLAANGSMALGCTFYQSS